MSTSHGTISIDSNADFVGQGFNGSGTVNDPWIIENLDIDAQSNGYAIVISNVDCYFVIRNCTLHGARVVEPDYLGSGIELYNVTNGWISNNTIGDCDAGIRVEMSDHNTFDANNITSNNVYGFYLKITVENVLSNNTISSTGGDGIIIRGSDGTCIINNTIIDNSGFAIYGLPMANSEIAYNDLSSNTNGLYLRDSDNNEVHDNVIDGNANFGVFAGGSSSNTLNNNSISNNTGHGIYFFNDASGNDVFHNVFIGNAVNAYDDTINTWNLSYPNGGNYWMDVDGNDIFKGTNQDQRGQDGFYDHPYLIEGGANQDMYPLVSPWNGTIPSDIWAPSVVDVEPADDNSSVNVSTVITIEFSEFMNISTFTYTLPDVDGQSLEWDPTSPTLTIDHDRLDYNTTYNLTVTGGEDLVGNPLSDIPLSVQFTTVEDLIPPYISIDSPTNGSHVGTSDITIEWTGGDDELGLDHYSIRVDDGAWDDIDNDTSSLVEGLSEGSHTIDVMAYDLADNGAMDSITIVVDLTPPSLVISSPTNDNYLHSHLINITWNGNDSLSGIDHYEVRIDEGAWTDVGMDESIDSGYFDDGEHVVDIKAIDSVGNEDIGSVEFTVDTVKPIAMITSPSNGDVLVDPMMTILWTASDVGVGIDRFEIHLDGSFAWAVTGNATEYVATMPQGDHGIMVKAYDLAGNSNFSASVNVTIDSIAPIVWMTGMLNDTAYGTSDVTMTWDVSDDDAQPGTGLNHSEMMLDHGSWEDVGTDMTIELIDVAEGQHTFNVRAFDNAGNVNATSIWFWVDLTDPSMDITYPVDDGYANTNHVNFTWNGSDEGSGIDHYELRLDDLSWKNVGISDHVTLVTYIPDDWHTVRMKAIDRAGNIAYDNVTFLLDSIAPSIEMDMETTNGMWNDTEMMINWTADDSSAYRDTSGISHFEVVVNDGKPIDVGLNTSYQIVDLTDGYWEATVTVYDNASNGRSYTMAFTIDLIPPDVRFTSPANGTLIGSDDEMVVYWIGEDNGTFVDHYVFFDEYNVIGSNRGLETSRTISDYPDGEHTIRIRAYDQAGNFGTAMMMFTVDSVAPSLVAFGPTGDDVPIDSTIEMTFSEPVMISTLTIDVMMDGHIVGGSFALEDDTIVYTPSSDLDHDTLVTVGIFAEDVVGNNVSETWTFTTISEDTTRDVSGRILDSNGDPVTGALILVDDVQVGVTDDDGMYTVTVNEGPHTVTIVADGLEDQEFDISPDDSGDVGTFYLDDVLDDGDDPTMIYVAVAIVAIAAVVGAVLFFRRRQGA